MLNKEVGGAKAAEQLAAEHALTAIEVADSLQKGVDAERESGAALKAQVDMLSNYLEDAKSIRLAAAELYVGCLSSSEAIRRRCFLSLRHSTSSLG